jgi:hypothetical protein
MSGTIQEPVVERCKYQDDSNVHHQPFPKPTLEEQQISRDDYDYHQQQAQWGDRTTLHVCVSPRFGTGWLLNAQLRANPTKCERSELPKIVRQLQRSLDSTEVVLNQRAKWLRTLMTTPFGSATKNRRTPQGSSVRGRTIFSPRSTALAWTSSTLSTSIDICG